MIIEKTKRLSSSQSYKIQMMRGLAIIAVVLIHNTPGGGGASLLSPLSEFCGWLVPFHEWNAF